MIPLRAQHTPTVVLLTDSLACKMGYELLAEHLACNLIKIPCIRVFDFSRCPKREHLKHWFRFLYKHRAHRRRHSVVLIAKPESSKLTLQHYIYAISIIVWVQICKPMFTNTKTDLFGLTLCIKRAIWGSRTWSTTVLTSRHPLWEFCNRSKQTRTLLNYDPTPHMLSTSGLEIGLFLWWNNYQQSRSSLARSAENGFWSDRLFFHCGHSQYHP